jgi:hypothetical protein
MKGLYQERTSETNTKAVNTHLPSKHKSNQNDTVLSRMPNILRF